MSVHSDSDPELRRVTMVSFDVIEEAPSHDDTPCFSAWEGHRAVDEHLAKWVKSDRPKYSIQIYDTTPSSRDPEHLKALALKLHKGTYEERMGGGDPDCADRLEVYGLAMPASTSDEDRVKQCIAHQEAEIISRHSTGKSDFYISGTYEALSYQRFLLIIDGPVNQLDGGEGEDGATDTETDTDSDTDDSPFVGVFWDFPDTDLAREESRVFNEQIEDPEFRRITPHNLGLFITWEVKSHIGWFVNSYIEDGLLEKEVARYAKRRADHGSGDIGQEELLEMEPETRPDEEIGGEGDDVNVAGAQEGVAALRVDSEAGPDGERPLEGGQSQAAL